VFEAGSQYGGDIVSGINQLMAQRRADQIANEILSKQYGVQNLPQRPGFNWWGQGGQTGGTAELQMRQAQAATEAKAQQDALAAQLKRAQIANYLAMARGTGRYSKDLTPAAQLAEQHRQQAAEDKANAGRLKNIQAWQKANTYDVNRLAKEFDTIHGKGSAERFYNAYANTSGSYGRLVNGQFVADPSGDVYTDTQVDPSTPVDASSVQTVPVAELQAYMGKLKDVQAAGGKLVPAPRAALVNAAPVAAQTTQNLPSGVSPAPRATLVNALPLPSGVSPEVPGDSDSGANAQLPTPQTQDDYDAIPSGSDFIDVDGIQKTKT
jgi:hypothetical protein